MICSICGKVLDNRVSYCDVCGYAVSNQAHQAQNVYFQQQYQQQYAQPTYGCQPSAPQQEHISRQDAGYIPYLEEFEKKVRSAFTLALLSNILSFILILPLIALIKTKSVNSFDYQFIAPSLQSRYQQAKGKLKAASILAKISFALVTIVFVLVVLIFVLLGLLFLLLTELY